MNADITLTNECIKSINNIGSITYMNICKGSSAVVRWGICDWLMSFIFAIAIYIMYRLFIKF